MPCTQPSLALSSAVFLGLLGACRAPGGPAAAETGVSVAPFGKTADGRTVEAWTLEGAGGLRAVVITYGAAVARLSVPDRDGRLADVVLGFDDLAGYESAANQFFGCTTGRFANRIAAGRFTLDGRVFELATNDGPNHLHGGPRGLDKLVWEAEEGAAADGPSVRLSTTSPDGDEGYPGALAIEVTYTLTDEGALRIDYRAETDAPTPVNLTHHGYFNLAGVEAGSAAGPAAVGVGAHELVLAAARYTPTDETLIPTGELAEVAGGPLDFTRPRSIAEGVEALDATPAVGLDHNFVLDSGGGDPAWAARLSEGGSGRVMDVYTTEPGLQVYSGNHLFGQLGKGGVAYPRRSAVCLETQHFPDSPNHPHFPGTILRPGEVYRQTTVYRFSTAP
ncbi:MAG: aldose epimerase family protein [Planctomycetota bacterium]|nr:aldose epimerase family protein [Planctomycetota bacterium]